MSNQDNHLYEFGEFRLDASARLLTRQGQTVGLTPKALDLLVALVRNPGELLDKETLLQSVWPDSFVEENNLADNVFKLRRALGEGFIETVPKRGYRFTASVQRPEEPEAPVPLPPEPKKRSLWIPALALVAATAILTALVTTWIQRPRAAQWNTALHTSILPPENTSFGYIVLSPDGRWLAFTATKENQAQLWLRAMGTGVVRAVEGTSGAAYPFWSPDGGSVGFFSGGRLKKVDLAGGLPATICEAPSVGTGGTWSVNGTILFTVLGDTRLWRVAASGGTPVEVVTAVPGQTDISEPFFLPDGQRFLYLALSGDPNKRGLYMASLLDPRGHRLMDHDSNAIFVPDDRDQGYLLFGREGALMAQAFDAATRRLVGDARRVAERLGTVPGSNVSYRRRNFTATAGGLLLYDPNPARLSAKSVWVDRHGKHQQTLPQLDDVSVALLSPDESRIAVARKDLATNNNDIWLANAKDGGGLVRFTFDPASDILGIWSPDGRRITWSSTRKGAFDLYQKESTGEGQDVPLLESRLHKFPLEWSPDGRYLLFRQIDPRTRHDIHVLPMVGDRKPFPYLHSTAMENGATFSPDGRWIAYASDETGRFEVYLESFPSHGGRRQISPVGGAAPRWRADGRELFYYSADRQLMSLAILNPATMTTGTPSPLFPFGAAGSATIASYAPTRDGQRFLLSAIIDSDPGGPMSVVANWKPVP
jgi:eukaryotic-like serine/threonine-protein kinase